jgi:hypothetical protein
VQHVGALAGFAAEVLAEEVGDVGFVVDNQGISGLACCSRRTGGSAFSTLRGAGACGEVANMRAFRESAAGDESKTDCSVTGRFGAKSASAAWRALVIRSRSSPRECGRCRRSGKSCSGGSLLINIEREFVNFGKLKVGVCLYPTAASESRWVFLMPMKLKGVSESIEVQKLLLWQHESSGYQRRNCHSVSWYGSGYWI